MIVDDLKASILNYAISGFFVKNSSDKTEDELNLLLKQKGEQHFKKEVLISSKIKPIDEVPYQIPDNWKWVRIGTISKIVSKGTTPQGGKNAYKDSGVKFLRAENVKDYKVDETNIQFISEEVHNGFLKRSILEDKDLLICIAGTLGRCGIVSKENLPLNTNQAVAFVRLINNELINVRYLGYAISSPVIQNLLIDQKKITAIPNLTLETITNCMIPLPPLEEQNRIVEKIEQLFEKLDDIKLIEEELIAIKSIFSANFKKSVLIYAVNGHLTIQNPNEVKVTISESLNNCDLPKNWIKVKAKTILNIVTGKRDANYGTEDGQYLFYTCANIPIKSPTYSFEGKNLILPGNGANVGLTIYSEDKFEAYQRTYVVNSKYDENSILLKYIYYYFTAYWNDYNKDKMFGSAIPYIKLGNLEDFEINIPPIEEQQRIVDKIEQILPLCDDIEKLVNEV